MFRFLGVLIVVLALPGCTNRTDQYRTVYSATSAGRAECNDQVGAGTISTRVGLHECYTSRENAAYSRFGHPHMDLMKAAQSYRGALAPKVDAGEVTGTEANALLDQLWANITSEIGRRDAARDQAAYTKSALYTNVLLGIASLNYQRQAVQQQNTRYPVICDVWGGTITCY